MAEFDNQTYFDKIKNLYNDTGFWGSPTQEKGGVSLYEKVNDDSGFKLYKVTGTIKDQVPKVLIEKVWNWRLAEWNNFSADTVKWDIIENVDETSRLTHQVQKLPWPIWSRDVSLLQSRFSEADTEYLIYKNVETPKIPRDDANYVRATVVYSAYIFKAAGPDTHFTRIIQVNPNGNIPTALVNSQSSSLLNIVSKLQSA
eukprot:TRINITY_DN12981_c0_g1_i1.p1 TRINITY_DN12981_c0_g1~~TRINITY_DN12981_c0_g1_i1.p1  ORF type:complete len:229 (+),score=39.53 TRINITY_DN12981_c0_g1_i1:89-688(+)